MNIIIKKDGKVAIKNLNHYHLLTHNKKIFEKGLNQFLVDAENYADNLGYNIDFLMPYIDLCGLTVEIFDFQKMSFTFENHRKIRVLAYQVLEKLHSISI